MRLGLFALGLLTAATKVFAEEVDAEQEVADKRAAYFGSATPNTELTNFDLTYVIQEYPDAKDSEVVQMWQGQEINVLHTITNREESDLTVVGLGGSFRDPITGAFKVNLTSNSVGPVVLGPGETAEVGQTINLDFLPGNYFLAPQVYVAFQDELKVIQARAQLTVLKEVPISFFNPQLLFLEALLVAIVGGVAYFLYPAFFQSYFNGTAPITKSKAASAKASGFDPSWVPSHHQATQRKSKTRKAY